MKCFLLCCKLLDCALPDSSSTFTLNLRMIMMKFYSLIWLITFCNIEQLVVLDSPRVEFNDTIVLRLSIWGSIFSGQAEECRCKRCKQFLSAASPHRMDYIGSILEKLIGIIKTTSGTFLFLPTRLFELLGECWP